MLPFCYPIAVIWSLGGALSDAAKYYTKCDLGSTSISTTAWLMFAISELRIEDGKLVGIATVISNSIGVAFMGMTILMKVSKGQQITTRVYLMFSALHIILPLVLSFRASGSPIGRSAVVSPAAFRRKAFWVRV
ncbi:unnamed protein product [Urochloa humidicola]